MIIVWDGFSGFGLSSLLPVKGEANTTAPKDILDNDKLPTLGQQLGEGPVLFPAGAGFGVEELQCAAQSPDPNLTVHLWH